MKTNVIDLYAYFGIKKPDGAKGTLTTYVLDNSEELSLKRVRPAMLVIPGGAYAMCSFREAEPIAVQYLAKGFCSFVLDYSVAPVTYPCQLLEACMSVIYIRENARELNVDTEHVCAVGFSAGGHLTGMLATMWDEKEVKDILGDKIALARPDGVILSYPVISSKEIAHKGSIINLTGNKEEMFAKFSLEDRVNENSVPAFIWTTADDTCVPAENSLVMACAYKKYNIPFELHIFPKGNHGLGLAAEETATCNHHCNPSAAQWIGLTDLWLKNNGFVIKN